MYPVQIQRIEESQVFVKKLMVTAISNICYLRGIFDESGYVSKKIGELPLRILSAKDPMAMEFVQHLTGAMDAISKGYVRAQLIIYVGL